MKYLNNFVKYIKESFNEDEERINEILNDMDEDYISLDHWDKRKFSDVKQQIPFTKKDEIYIDKKLKIYDIEVKSYIDKSNEFRIYFNKLNNEFIDLITIQKYENHWFTANLNINGSEEDFLCNETEGLLTLIKDYLFKFSKNQKFLHTFFTDRKDYLNEIIGKKENKFIFYSNPTLADMIIENVDILMPDGMTKNIIEYMDYFKINTISNYYYLYEHKKISLQSLLIEYPALLEEREGILYLRFYGHISDLAFMFDKDDSNRNSSGSQQFVEDYKIENIDYGYRNSNFRDLYIGDLTTKALNIIKAKIEKVKSELDEDDEDLELFKQYANDWEKQIEKIDALSDIKSEICNAYDDAQEAADHDAQYDAIIKPILNFMYMKEMIYIDEGYLFTIDKQWFIKYDFLNDSTKYAGYASKENPNVKNLGSNILEYFFTDLEYGDEIYEVTKLKIDFPYYGWQRDIVPEYLEDRIDDRLNYS